MPDSADPVRQQAQRILQGATATLPELSTLADELKTKRDFTTARRILARARAAKGVDAKTRLKLAQQHALCTYKDPNLPADQRLERALEILGEADELDTTRNQETLGLTGAIHKRRWEIDGQRHHLERALFFYKRGYAEGAAVDFGYTGINAAFVLDLLASEEEEEAATAKVDSPSATLRRTEADEIRKTLIAELPRLAANPAHAWLNDQWWFLVTLAEAFVGLDEYDKAIEWVRKARALPNVADWEYESTARQFVRLARLREGDRAKQSPAAAVLRELLGGNEAAVESMFAGKVGLALSGGGFRASLFHIGVLARLAELDVLRHVEVLSCVSGGSILGAHYYLELRHLLQTKSEAELSQRDYIELVKRLEKNFLCGVQRNIRTRVAANIWANLKMIFLPGYSRTMRLGELYESLLYSSVPDGESGPRWLNQLFVRPKDGPPEFQPKLDNWKRAHKVPILILNATTLNTGHNWQFTASWMGEPPMSINSEEADAADRLRRMYYPDAPRKHRQIRLGYAVAASSCVPGLFEPLALDGLYPDRIVRLVDGGVYDNQGTAGLLGEDCTVLLVSDASGQIASQAKPPAGSLAVPLRANDILMARVRGAEYGDLDARRRASLLRGVMFLHLKKDLPVTPVDWIDCNDPYLPSEDPEETQPAARRGPLTRYDVRKDVQEKLAAIRTDLDSFSDTEAFALMTSGYRMAKWQFSHAISSLPVREMNERWRFLDVAPALDKSDGSEADHAKLLKVLNVANKLAFKVWFLRFWLSVLGIFLLAGMAALLGWAAWTWWDRPLLAVTTGNAVMWTAGVLLAFLIPTIYKIVHYRDTLRRAAMNFAVAIVGFLLAWLHLAIFDPLFLRFGRVAARRE